MPKFAEALPGEPAVPVRSPTPFNPPTPPVAVAVPAPAALKVVVPPVPPVALLGLPPPPPPPITVTFTTGEPKEGTVQVASEAVIVTDAVNPERTGPHTVVYNSNESVSAKYVTIPSDGEAKAAVRAAEFANTITA